MKAFQPDANSSTFIELVDKPSEKFCIGVAWMLEDVLISV